MIEQPEQLMFHGREIAMTPDEKAAMRHKLLAYTLSNPPRVAGSGAFSWVRRHAVVSSALAFALVLGATGVSASMAGPNDALYDFRLQVNDRIESAITFDEESQIDVEMRQIGRQLDAEARAGQEILTDEDEQPVPAETEEPEKVNMIENLKNNLKARLNIGKKSQAGAAEEDDDESKSRRNQNLQRGQNNDELDEELRQLENELQQEESASLELEI